MCEQTMRRAVGRNFLLPRAANAATASALYSRINLHDGYVLHMLRSGYREVSASRKRMRNDDQLRQLFNGIFDALPDTVRSKLEEFWQSHHVRSEEIDERKRFYPPIIREAHIANQNLPRRQTPPLQDSISRAVEDLARIRHFGSVWAQTTGLIFRFKTSIVDAATEDVLKTLIAHELAHAYHAAQVGQPFPMAGYLLGRSETEEEQAVVSLLNEWGFSQGTIAVWQYQNRATVR